MGYQNSSRSSGGRSSGGGYGGGRKSSFSYPRQKSRGPAKEYINPSRFISAAKTVEPVLYDPKHKFADFEVDELIHTNLDAKGFVLPTPIQDQTIPAGLEGRDIVGIADTGTGKTAAFAIPMLQRLINDPKARVLVMAPTRELAQQIEEECRTIGRGTGLRSVLLIGGVAIGPQFRDLRANPRVVIGTPGRIQDHMEQGTLDISDVSIVVLDEVDRMLDMGFIIPIREILSKVPAERQSFFFSATMDPRVKGIIDGFTADPLHVVAKSGETAENVEQNIVEYRGTIDKIDQLHQLLTTDLVTKAVIFDDTQRAVERLSIELAARGFKTDAIHGGKSQSQRQRALKRFKDNDVTVLVATDVAARGIDIKDISHVVNYSTPQSYSDYVHRVGRAGRAGRTGYALTFIER
jgi:superfamily II DNA/RNA helicase